MFILAPHLLFAVAILGVGIAEESVALTAVSLGLFVAGLYLTHRKGVSIGPRTEMVLALVAAGAAWAYSRAQGQQYFYFLQYWLLSMMIIRSFRRKTKRDYIFCFLIAAGLFAHVGRVYGNLPFMIPAILNLILLPYALFYFLAYYGGFQKTGPLFPPEPIRLSMAQFRFMTGISLLLAVLVVLCFVVIPRGRTGLPFGRAADQHRSGFSDNVALGSFSSISALRNIVMIVETTRPQFWRGQVLDYYENGIWKATAKAKWRRPRQARPVAAGVPETVRRFKIRDTRLVNHLFFSAGNIVTLNRIRTPRDIWINDLYCVVGSAAYDGVNNQAEYEVKSQDSEYVGFGTLSRQLWRSPGNSEEFIAEEDIGLQLPADTSAEVRQLAQTITAGMNSTDEKAKAVERYLNSNYTYSLEGLNSGTRSPLDYFLFESKRGHCEYFATAMAILLRAGNVRTRVVQGFAPGAYENGECIVRLSDAHLWTEVFYPDRGWKMFDPTPGSLERLSAGGTISMAERLRLKWEAYVLDYDGRVQADLLGWARSQAVLLAERLAPRAPGMRRLWMILPVAAVLILLVVFRKRLRIPGVDWSRFRRGRTSAGKAMGYFGQYLKELTRKGYKRHPGTTPNDLILALERDAAPIIEEARLLTRLFYNTRFGGSALTAENEQSARAAVRRIHKWATR